MNLKKKLCIANMNFMRTDQGECAFYERFMRAEHRELLNIWELSIVNVSFMRAEHWECDFHESWVLCTKFLRAVHCKCEFYASWVLQMWILWELRIVNMNNKETELWECEFIECWESFIWTLRELLVHLNFMRVENCECE